MPILRELASRVPNFAQAAQYALRDESWPMPFGAAGAGGSQAGGRPGPRWLKSSSSLPHVRGPLLSVYVHQARGLVLREVGRSLPFYRSVSDMSGRRRARVEAAPGFQRLHACARRYACT